MSKAGSELPRIAVIPGQADDMRAVVYVRLLDGHTTLEGTLRGPRCRHASTLSTTAVLRLLPPLPGNAADLPTCEAVLVEPGFWSPELPNRYQLNLRLGGDATTISRLVGVRRLGHRDGAFRLDGRRYVPRFVHLDGAGSLQPDEAAVVASAARMSAAAIWAVSPSPALCEAADAVGVMLLAELAEDLDDDQAAREVARLAVHPSVGFLLLPPGQQSAAESWRGFRGTLQIGLRVDGSFTPAITMERRGIANGIDFLMVTIPEGGLPQAGWLQTPHLPAMVCRPLPAATEEITMQERRRGCDRLQADLAAWLARDGRPAWEPAGYAV